MRQHKYEWVLYALAFWPVWIWLYRRLAADPDELAGLSAAVMALFFTRMQCTDWSRRLALGSVAIYTAAFPFTPPLVHALLAFASIALACGMRLQTAGLLLLALPLTSSLQFYLGHPLRLASAWIAALSLRLAGASASADGTALLVGKQLVEVDGPCSGVRMLWAGLLLFLTLASVWLLTPGRVALGCFATVVVVCIANGLRSAALYYVESNPAWPQWLHTAAGIATFTALAFLLAASARLRQAHA